MGIIIRFLLVTIAGIFVFPLFQSCHEDPESLVGFEIPEGVLINSWTIEDFTQADSSRADDFQGIVMTFDKSRRLFINKGGTEFETLWSLRATSLSLSIDVADTLLRELSGVYVSLEEIDSLANTLDLTNSNPRTPSTLLLEKL